MPNDAPPPRDISEHLNKNEVIEVQKINQRQGEGKVEGSKMDLEIIDSIKLYVFSSVIFQPWKFNHEGMNVIWRAQLASKFLFNHSEYKIMLDRPGCCEGVGEILVKFPERQANL